MQRQRNVVILLSNGCNIARKGKAPSWLASSLLVRALHWYHRGQGSNTGKADFFSGFSFSSSQDVYLTVMIFSAFITFSYWYMLMI